MIDRVAKHLAFHTFVQFLVRDHGFTEEQAKLEVEFVTQNDIVVTQYHYVYNVRRIGSTKTLSRAERGAVYRTLMNAINHATF